MKVYLKKILYLFIILLINLFITGQAKAVCPVCTITICFGVGLSRWLGIDDIISGIWIGGLVVSMIIWFLGWLNKKQILFRFRWFIVSILFYLIILVPLYFKKIIGHPLNKIWGIDKLLFGIMTGSLIFLFSVWLHNFLKKKNQGKSFFPFQKVVLPILSLIIASLIFYLTICK